MKITNRIVANAITAKNDLVPPKEIVQRKIANMIFAITDKVERIKGMNKDIEELVAGCEEVAKAAKPYESDTEIHASLGRLAKAKSRLLSYKR